MKKIQKFVMAFLLGAMTIGFTACSSDNGVDEEFNLPEVGQATTSVSSSDKEMQKVGKNYVQAVVYPTHRFSDPLYGCRGWHYDTEPY